MRTIATRIRCLACSLPLALALALTGAPLAAELRPAGPEVLLTPITEVATCPAAAALPDGSFVVVWAPGQFLDRAGCNPAGRVVAQRLDRYGQPVGEPFVLGRTGRSCVFDLQVGSPADDGIPISWTKRRGELGAPRQVVHRLLTEGRSGGRPVLDQPGFALVHLRAGGMVVLTVPTSDGAGGRALQAQRFTAAGRPGPPLRIPLGLMEFDDSKFAAAEVAPGTLVAVWGDPQDLLSGRRFQVDGTLLGPIFRVADSDLQFPFPRVAGNGQGRFVVAWFNVTDRAGEARAQVFGPRRALTAPFPVNTQPAGTQLVSSVEMAADGRMAFSWESARQPGEGWNAVGRLFTPDGRGIDRAVELASDPAGFQLCSLLVAGRGDDGAPDGRWLAVWKDQNGNGLDGPGIVARLLVEEP